MFQRALGGPALHVARRVKATGQSPGIEPTVTELSRVTTEFENVADHARRVRQVQGSGADPTQRTGRVVGGKESIGFVQFLDRRVQRGRQFVAGPRRVGVEVAHDAAAYDFLFSTQRPGGSVEVRGGHLKSPSPLTHSVMT